MSFPDFTDGIDVAVGDAILAAHVDNLADNTEANREMSDVGHNFGISTGDGYHRGLYSNPLIFKASASVWGSQWLDDTDPTNIVFRMMSGVSAAAVTPAAKTDGVVIGVGGFV